MTDAQQLLFDMGSHVTQLPNVLLTLQPEWYQLVLDNIKKYEYRRKYLRQPSTAFIYVGGTFRAICAKLDFGQPIIASIDEIVRIRKTERSGGGEGVRTYLKGLKEGFAIPILKCQRIKPISLDDLRRNFSNFTVPQSYILLDRKPELLEFLLRQPILDEQENTTSKASI